MWVMHVYPWESKKKMNIKLLQRSPAPGAFAIWDQFSNKLLPINNGTTHQ